MVCSLQLLLSSLLLKHLVVAIPAKMLKLPDTVGISHIKTVLLKPSELVLTLDQFCQVIFQQWWEVFRERRARTQREMLAHPEQHIDFPVPLAYEEYGINDPPVEGIKGQPLDFSLISGYRHELYSCDGSCQDIRTNVEWIVSAIVDNNRAQIRVRNNVGFPCPLYYKAEYDFKPSRRDYETPSEEIAALKLLKSMASESMASYQVDDPDVIGDTRRSVIGCKCVKMTRAERGAYDRLLEIRKKRRDEAAIYNAKKRRKGEASYPGTSRKSPRPKQPRDDNREAKIIKEHPSATVVPVLTAEPADEMDDRMQMDADNIFGYSDADHNTLQCYDYDFPFIPEMLHNEHLQGDSQSYIPGPASPEALAFIEATLSSFSGYEAPAWTSASSSGKSNNGKHS